MKAIIEERRRNADGSTNSCTKRSDFLEILLDVDTLYEDEKVSFILDSLLGGYETTSLLMAMVVYFLAQSPSALQRLKVITYPKTLISSFIQRLINKLHLINFL